MSLRDDEHRIRQSTFLCRLDPQDQDALLRLASRETATGREELVRPDEMVLLLRGEAEVTLFGEATPRRGGSGRLYGAGAVVGERAGTVIASSPVELLRWRAADIRPPGLRWQVRDLIQDLAELEHQVVVLDEVLRHEPTLRLLPFDLREVLLQCSAQKEFQTGELLIEAGQRSEHLILLLRGHARLFSDSQDPGNDRRRAQVLPEGLLLGVQDLSRDTPPEQPYHIEAGSPVRVLEIPWRALSLLAERSRLLRHHVAPVGPRGQRGQSHVVLGAGSKVGATALCIGTSIALQQDHERTVAMLDMDGWSTAQRLGLTPEPVRINGMDLRRASLGGSLPDLWWPSEGGDALALHEELTRRNEHVLVNVTSKEQPPAEFLDRFSTVIRLYTSAREGGSAPVSPHQRLIHALRQPPEGYPDRHTRPLRRDHGPENRLVLQQMIRVPWDPVVSEVYAGRRVIRQLGIGETAFGRASGRLARMLLGKAVGLALGGGGAWGFAHMGLLRALHEGGIPVDYVAGTSFGAVVGATWVARGNAGLDDLLKHTWIMPVIAGSCVVRTTALGALVDRVAGPVHHLATEVPLLAVSADVRTAAPFVLPAGTLADAVRASSGFPGLFAHYTYGGRRLVDGGVAANVPAEIVHQAGADFILASNCIPPFIDQSPDLMEVPVVSRAVDLVRSTLALMHRSSTRDASLADHVFDAHVEGFAPFQFNKGVPIAERAYEQACRELPAIRAAYEADLTTHVRSM
ncbi:MAG: patatin-like phospholipase family protein [Alphaproteobacteria bacterium]|nr:patatin-like phospholipase family protein [Alphaproteobacteria bacterium]